MRRHEKAVIVLLTIFCASSGYFVGGGPGALGGGAVGLLGGLLVVWLDRGDRG